MESHKEETMNAQPDTELTAQNQREQQTIFYQSAAMNQHRGPSHTQSPNDGFQRNEDENLPMKQML